MKKIMGLCLLLSLVLCSCTKKPQEIFEDQKSGVVMVLNKFYYKMTLPDGSIVYFNGMNEDGGLEGFTEDESEAKANPAMCFGTAFFIDEDGSLLTNRHVASPPIDKDAVKKVFANFIRNLQDRAYAYMEDLEEQYQQAEEEAETLVETDDEGNVMTDEDGKIYTYDVERMEELQEAVDEMAQQYKEAQEAVEELDKLTDVSQITIEPVCELGISFDGSSPNDEDDFLKKRPCKVVRVSGNEEVDLALLKYKGEMPDDVYIFDPQAAKDDLGIGSKVYMIGYNAGMEIGFTKKGIKSQFTQGTVTQQPDGERVLYDIPTISGSSGSPVVNEKGELVAVNFAKYNKSDNFNLGIPLKAIRNFLDK